MANGLAVTKAIGSGSPAPAALMSGSTRADRAGNSFAAYLAKYRLGGTRQTQTQPSATTIGAGSPLGTSAQRSDVATLLRGTDAVGANAPLRAESAAGQTATTAPTSRVGGTVKTTQPAAVQRAEMPTSVSQTGASRPMSLAEFPRPANDNGRGMHWVPITYTTNDVVDRYVAEAEKMGIKWMVLLNDGTRIGENDYLVDRLVEKGIMPVMRVYTPNGQPIEGDLEALVRHYRERGVQYFQLYNEPNLNVENPDGTPNVDRYVDLWTKAARAVVAGGGLPGFGALSPGGNYDDIEFLNRALDRIKAKGDVQLLDRAWLSLHNYTFNHPLDYTKDSNGYLKFRWYDAIVREKLGRSMPIIGTEGGTFVGANEDKTLPAVTPEKQVEMVVGAYDCVQRRREPYYFAYTYWLIANEAGGGHDRGFSHHALFKPDGVSPVVDALRRTANRGTAQ